MSIKDQLLFSALHGTAIRHAAECRNLDESIDELRQIADGRNDILAEVAGIEVCSWYASPATHVCDELIRARMLMAAHRRSRAIDAIEDHRCAADVQ